MSLSVQVLRGSAWNFIEQFLRRGVSAASTILLSYFLAPADFGLISMMAVFLALGGSLMDSGLREALIRRKRLSPRLLSTATWAALALGLVSYVLIFLAAPAIARFYGHPELVALIRVASLMILANALQTAPSALLNHALDFKAFMKASFPASLVSCAIALALAALGVGVWALVAQSLVATVLTTVLLWRQARFPLRWGVDLKPLASLYGFGYKLFLSNLISIGVKNTAPILIGKLLGAVNAGYYYFVDKIMEVVMGQLVYSVQGVTYPAFSRISGDDAQLKEGYRKVIAVSVFIVSPCLLIPAGMAEALFGLVFADKWLPAAVCFQLFCVLYLFYPLHAINLNILKVKGRSDLFLKLEIIKAVIGVGAVLLAVRHGLIALLLAQIAGSILCYLPNSFYSRRMIGYTVAEQIADFAPGFAVAAAAGGASWLVADALRGHPALLVVLAAGLAGSACFFLLAFVLRLRALGLLRTVLGLALQKARAK